MFRSLKSRIAQISIKRRNDGVHVGRHLKKMFPFGGGATVAQDVVNPNPIANPLLNPLAGIARIFKRR